MNQIPHFIEGRRTADAGGRYGDVFNPATGERTGRVSFGGPAEVDAAVTAAARASVEWARTTPLNRARVMFRFKAMVEREADALAAMITAEHGKVIGDARGEVTRGLEVVEFASGIPHLLKGEFTESVGAGIDSCSMRQPLGVCVGITPFNFPAMVPMWMFPVAMACGNTFMLKPPAGSVVSVRIGELLKEAGLPDGVFNVVNGDKEAVDALLAHPGVAAVSFVGSTPIAEYIYATARGAGKACAGAGRREESLMVMPDADLDQAVDALMGAAYGSAGERCMAISVAVAVGDRGRRPDRELAPRLRTLDRARNRPQVEMGPLVTRQHLERVRGYIDRGAGGRGAGGRGRDFRGERCATAFSSVGACSTR